MKAEPLKFKDLKKNDVFRIFNRIFKKKTNTVAQNTFTGQTQIIEAEAEVIKVLKNSLK